MPFGRVRGQRRLVEVSLGDLAFDACEAAALVERLAVGLAARESEPLAAT